MKGVLAAKKRIGEGSLAVNCTDYNVQVKVSRDSGSFKKEPLVCGVASM